MKIGRRFVCETFGRSDWSDFARYPMRDYPTLADFVAGGYHQAAVVDGVVIYARNGG